MVRLRAWLLCQLLGTLPVLADEAFSAAAYLAANVKARRRDLRQWIASSGAAQRRGPPAWPQRCDAHARCDVLDHWHGGGCGLARFPAAVLPPSPFSRWGNRPILGAVILLRPL
jgi:hypothetical protein